MIKKERITRNSSITVGVCDRHHALSDYRDYTERVVLCFEADCRGDEASLCLECIKEAFALYAEEAQQDEPPEARA